MSLLHNIPHYSFSDLEKIFERLKDLESENLLLKMDLEDTRSQLDIAQKLADYKKTRYSNIKKFFKSE